MVEELEQVVAIGSDEVVYSFVAGWVVVGVADVCECGVNDFEYDVEFLASALGMLINLSFLDTVKGSMTDIEGVFQLVSRRLNVVPVGCTECASEIDGLLCFGNPIVHCV